MFSRFSIFSNHTQTFLKTTATTTTTNNEYIMGGFFCGGKGMGMLMLI